MNPKSLLILSFLISLVIVPSVLFLNEERKSNSYDYLNEAQELIEIDGRKYKINVNLYRDFMPGITEDSTKLSAIVTIVALDELTFPILFYMDKIWIFNKNTSEVWESKFTSETHVEEKNIYRNVARNGPKWETGSEVDVFVRIIRQIPQNNFLNTVYYLKSSNQIIEAVF